MRKKEQIEVRHKDKVVAIINRVLKAEMMGNFNPIFCTYKGKERLVKSEEGDLSDPFRREESYRTSLYIEVE